MLPEWPTLALGLALAGPPGLPLPPLRHPDAVAERAGLALAPMQAPGPAATPGNPARAPFEGRLPVPAQRLAELRGGFRQGPLLISFGIERAVSIGGQLMTTTRLNVVGAAPGAGGWPALLAGPAAGGVALVRDGVARPDVLPRGLSASALGTVVQNAMQGQRIQAVTTIDATLQVLPTLRSLQLQSTLRDAIGDSLRR